MGLELSISGVPYGDIKIIACSCEIEPVVVVCKPTDLEYELITRSAENHACKTTYPVSVIL
jgi:hypothetical protein